MPETDPTTVVLGGGILTLLIKEIVGWLRTHMGDAPTTTSLREEVRKLMVEVVTMRVKVDTLWDIYIGEGQRDARRRDLLRANSPLTPTEKFLAHFDSPVISDIQARLKKHRETLNATETAALLYWDFRKELLAVSERADLPVGVIISCLKAMADRADGPEEPEMEPMIIEGLIQQALTLRSSQA